MLTGAMWPVLNQLNARCDLDKLVCGGFGAENSLIGGNLIRIGLTRCRQASWNRRR